MRQSISLQVKFKFVQNDTTYFGALVGRVANRISGAQFTLNGVVYKLPDNDNGNTLHGMIQLPLNISNSLSSFIST